MAQYFFIGSLFFGFFFFILVKVTWVRKFYFTEQDGTERHELQLLTVGTNTFIDDSRYSIDFQFPSNFRLSIQNVSKENDEGVYLCQVCMRVNET